MHMPTAQATRPEHFSNRWIVAGAPDEEPHARRLCEVMGHELNGDDRSVVRVRFTDGDEALLSPHMLFPA